MPSSYITYDHNPDSKNLQHRLGGSRLPHDDPKYFYSLGRRRGSDQFPKRGLVDLVEQKLSSFIVRLSKVSRMQYVKCHASRIQDGVPRWCHLSGTWFSSGSGSGTTWRVAMGGPCVPLWVLDLILERALFRLGKPEIGYLLCMFVTQLRRSPFPSGTFCLPIESV